MTRAFAYLRVSGRGQVDGDGFDRQLIACQNYAQSISSTIIFVFREEGVSGKNDLADRPALSDLLASLEEQQVSTVIIEKLDRLARDVVVQEVIVREFIARGITLISTMEQDLCSNDPTRKFIRQIFGALAEYDREITVLKLRGARQRMKAKTGRCEGVKPFGELPGEDYALHVIRENAGYGVSYAVIAGTLNASSVKTRSGKPWSYSTVRKIAKRLGAK